MRLEGSKSRLFVVSLWLLAGPLKMVVMCALTYCFAVLLHVEVACVLGFCLLRCYFLVTFEALLPREGSQPTLVGEPTVGIEV